MNSHLLERWRELAKKYPELLERVQRVDQELKKLRTNQYEQRSQGGS
jgi:hypothetical protein